MPLEACRNTGEINGCVKATQESLEVIRITGKVIESDEAVRESLNGSWIAGEDIKVVKAAQDSFGGCGIADEDIDANESVVMVLVTLTKLPKVIRLPHAVESLEGCKNADEGPKVPRLLRRLSTVM